MKRQRHQEEDIAARPPQKGSASSSNNGGFRFCFFGGGGEDGDGPAGSPDNDDEGEGAASAPPPTTHPGPWGREALLLPSAAEGEGGGGGGGGQPQRVRVMWEESGGRQGLLKVQLLEQDETQTLKVEPWRLRPLLPDTDTDTAAAAPPAASNQLLEENDLVFDPAHSHGPVPPPLGPSLNSLLYPITPTRFLADIYGRKALAVHDVGGRARRVVRDLMAAAASSLDASPPSILSSSKNRKKRKRGQGNAAAAASAPVDALDVAALLRAATRTVVWMRAKDGGKGKEGEMQYLDEVPPEVAWACHRAGHSLYFNPSLAFQRPYIRAVLRELGMMGVGDGGEGMGGDVEVFAVRGAHSTPWHFDAQDNITIQLRGCKRWRVRPSGLSDPLTNLHPASASHAALRRDLAVHAACKEEPLAPPTPQEEQDGATATVLLRPGSVLYVPCGWWHRVESLGDHPEGSLSINLSLDPQRWAGLLHAALGPALWGADALRARARWAGSGEEDAVAVTREVVGQMLEALRARLAAVSPADLLPLAAFDEGQEEGDEDNDGEEEGREGSGLVIVEAGTGGLVDDQEEEGFLSSSSSDEVDGGDVEGVGGGKAAERLARARGAVQARAGLSTRAGWRGSGGASVAAAADVAFARSPLAALVVQEEATTRGHAACLLHRGFALDLAPAPAPTATVRIEAPPLALGALQALAALGPGQRGTLAGLLDGESMGGDREVVVRRLVGVLVYQGYLRPGEV